jgi:hypothetical protein
MESLQQRVKIRQMKVDRLRRKRPQVEADGEGEPS